MDNFSVGENPDVGDWRTPVWWWNRRIFWGIIPSILGVLRYYGFLTAGLGRAGADFEGIIRDHSEKCWMCD
jgi:hypothetical protein